MAAFACSRCAAACEYNFRGLVITYNLFVFKKLYR